MATDRISRVVSQYEAGAITEGSACLDVLMAAGEGDAEAIFASLPPWLRQAVTRHIAEANPAEERILESSCGSASDEEYAADLPCREEIMRRGIVALKRVTSGATGLDNHALQRTGRAERSLRIVKRPSARPAVEC